MSGHWVKINDIRVRCDAHEFGPDTDPVCVARCLSTLYSAEKPILEDEEFES